MEKLETLKPMDSSKFSWIQGPTPEYIEGTMLLSDEKGIYLGVIEKTRNGYGWNSYKYNYLEVISSGFSPSLESAKADVENSLFEAKVLLRPVYDEFWFKS